MNWLYFVGGELFGFLALIYHKWITDRTGRISIAEKYLGRGGTYNFWKLAGVALIAFGFYALVNL